MRILFTRNEVLHRREERVFVELLKVREGFEDRPQALEGGEDLNAAHRIHWVTLVERYGHAIRRHTLRSLFQLEDVVLAQFGADRSACADGTTTGGAGGFSRPRGTPGFRRAGPSGSEVGLAARGGGSRAQQTSELPLEPGDVVVVDPAAPARREHVLDHIDAIQESIDSVLVDRQLVASNTVQHVLQEMCKLRQLHHLHSGGGPLEGVGGAKDLVYGVVIGRFVFENQDVAFKGFDLQLSLYEEILEQLLVVRVKVVAHRVPILAVPSFKSSRGVDDNKIGRGARDFAFFSARSRLI